MTIIKMQKKCKECNFVGNYTYGLYARNPHYWCELMWDLYKEDYKVNPEEIDEKFPLKNVISVVEE